MKLVRVFNEGKVIYKDLYSKLMDLDKHIFYGCGNEFHKNRDWWVVEDKGNIIAYCGCIYAEGICIFNRAWVQKKYRGQGLQDKMIKKRLQSAKKTCRVAITYTTFDNIYSANNLIRNKFTLYNPVYTYAGTDKLYFIKYHSYI